MPAASNRSGPASNYLTASFGVQPRVFAWKFLSSNSSETRGFDHFVGRRHAPRYYCEPDSGVAVDGI